MKKLLVLALILFPLFANAGGCDKYNAFHSTQAHHTTICTCDSCHLGSLNKGTAPTTCVGCHMGARPAAPQKPLTHIASGSIDCASCHSSTSFVGAHMNHSVVSGQSCTTCHGVTSRGKPNGHIPTTLDCDTCHKTTSWDAKMSHVGITTGCITCHSKDKLSSHIQTTLSCENCHSGFATWMNGRYTHTGAENCTICHANSAVTGVTQKGATHPITIASCLTCHSGTVTFNCALNEIELFVNRIYAYLANAITFA